MKKSKQMSEKLITGILLAMVGGFLDAYTYLCRGHVFANAQTGNIVLLGIRMSNGNIKGAIYYLMPILAFVTGVIMANLIKLRYKEIQMVHWRQIIVAIEIVVLCGVASIGDDHNTIANILVSFVCSLQVESFRKVNGYAYATTMCTGNLRSGTEHIFAYIKTKDKSKLYGGLHYYVIIAVFVIGAVCGALMTERFSVSAVYFTVVVLLVTLVLMFKKEKEVNDVNS